MYVMTGGHFVVCAGAFCALTARLWAGGSGLNVAVVVNQNSTNSLELANYYCELRQIPPQNVLRMNWTGGNIAWTTADFGTVLVNPLLALLSSRQLTNQIDYVVLSMDIPFQVTEGDSVAVNSTTSSLFYGFKPDPNAACSMAPGSTNLYAGSESVFRAVPPLGAASNSFLVTMITSSNLALAKQIALQGGTSDSTFPTQTVFLTKSYDPARNVRFVLFDNAIFNTRLRGNYSMQRTVAYTPNDLGYTLGFQGGAADYTLSGVTVAPGGIADNLTSYGGLINGSDQINMLTFLAAGATATYGTVDEPCNYLEKFPNPLDYFYQARGFSLAEAYYQSVTNPYQGLMVGEPLAAPFATPATGAWLSLPANALLQGATNLSLQVTAADAHHPVSQVDLFLDGTFLETLTNLTPQAGNLLNVNLNGQLITYAVPANAALNSIATGLANALNEPANTNATKVIAFAAGDRIELQLTDLSTPGAQVSLAASSALGAAPALTTFLQATGTNFLDSIAYGLRGFTVTNAPLVGDYLQLVATKVDGESITNALTNTTAGITVFDLRLQLHGRHQRRQPLAGLRWRHRRGLVQWRRLRAEPQPVQPARPLAGLAGLASPDPPLGFDEPLGDADRLRAAQRLPRGSSASSPPLCHRGRVQALAHLCFRHHRATGRVPRIDRGCLRRQQRPHPAAGSANRPHPEHPPLSQPHHAVQFQQPCRGSDDPVHRVGQHQYGGQHRVVQHRWLPRGRL